MFLIVALAMMIIFGIVLVRVSPEVVSGTAEGVVQALRNLGGVGLIVFGLLQVVVVVSGILPASLLGVAAGAIYGFLFGFVLAAVGTMIGAVLAFFLSRSVFRPAVERLASRHPRLQNLDALIARDGWKLACLLRVSPIMPFAATSYLLGLSSINLRNYLLGTLGSLPALAGYVFLGTLADASLLAWVNGAGLVHWLLLGLGGLATLILTMRLGQIAFQAGITSRPGPGARMEHRLPPHQSPDT